MTTQVGELVLFNGKKLFMSPCPLEAYWDSMPPRPYMLADSSGCWRGYAGEWELADNKLYLTKFEATAWKTSKDWIGDEELSNLWLIACHGKDSVAEVIATLANLPAITTAARKGAAMFVVALGEQLLAQGKLTPDSSEQDLYRAAVAANWACLTKEEHSISLDTLFPEAGGRVLAAWYTGELHIDEGELLEGGHFPIYELTHLIEIRDGCVIKAELRKNSAPTS